MERSTIVQTSSDDEYTSTAMNQQDMVLKSSHLRKARSESSTSSADIKLHSAKRKAVVSDESDMDVFETGSTMDEAGNTSKQSTSSVSVASGASGADDSSVNTLDVGRSSSTSSSSTSTDSSSTSSLFDQEMDESPVLASSPRRRSHPLISELPLQRRTSSADDGSLILNVKRSKKRRSSFPAAPPASGNSKSSQKAVELASVAGDPLRAKPNDATNRHLTAKQALNSKPSQPSILTPNEPLKSKPNGSSRVSLVEPPNARLEDTSSSDLFESIYSKFNEPSKPNPNESFKPIESVQSVQSKPIESKPKTKPIESKSKPKPIESNPKPKPKTKPRPTSKPSKSWKVSVARAAPLLPPRPADSLAIVDLYAYTPPFDQLAVRPATKQQLKQWVEAPVAPSLCILHGPPGSGKVVAARLSEL